MAKKTYYYKFVIKLDHKLRDIDIDSIKKVIQKNLYDTPITDIHGGIANNSNYYKFGKLLEKGKF